MKNSIFSIFAFMLLLLAANSLFAQKSTRMRSTPTSTQQISIKEATVNQPTVTTPVIMAETAYNPTPMFTLIYKGKMDYEQGGSSYNLIGGNTANLSDLAGNIVNIKVNDGYVMWVFTGANYSGEKKVLQAGLYGITNLGESFRRPGSSMIYPVGEIVLFSAADFQGTPYQCIPNGLSNARTALPTNFPTEVGSYANFGSYVGLYTASNTNSFGPDFGIINEEKRTLTDSQINKFRSKFFEFWLKS
jgi:hypothetical protein